MHGPSKKQLTDFIRVVREELGRTSPLTTVPVLYQRDQIGRGNVAGNVKASITASSISVSTI